MKLFKKLFSALNGKSVKYMIAGGIAVNLYGIERATADIDIVLRIDEDNISKFISAAKDLGLKPKAPVRLEDFLEAKKRQEWLENKGMIVFSLYDARNLFFLLDVFIETPFDFDKVYRQRAKIKFEDLTIPVVPMKELISMKEKTKRPQDIADVYYLKKFLKDWKDEK